jgi:hypothetical protein
MVDRRTGSPAVRLALALLLLTVAALLLVPAAPPAHRRSWDDLIAPLGVGRPVTRGFVLSPPRRGEEHDVVYVARRDRGPAGPAGRVEVHIVDRGHWTGITETRSFGIEWELPPTGSTVVAAADDARAVTHALADAIAKNDSGFASVDSIPLGSEPTAPLIARILDRLSGTRGALIGGAVAVALVLLVSVPHGALAVALLLFVLGLVLRGTELGLPFTHDQDVQRLFTGHLPLREIATGAGLKDRHPPLYFFILHFTERFGQSEAVARAPAVLAGALAGPAMLLAAARMCGQVDPAAALVALVVTASPELVARSREVSEMPLFALIVITAAAALVAAVREPRPARLATVALSHALALFTYYLGPFILAANAAVLVSLRHVDRRIVKAFAVGAFAGMPALGLGAVTLFRDWSAREAARAFPALAWGEHSPLQMTAEMGRIAVEALGLPFLALLLVAIVIGVHRHNLAVITPVLGAAATCAGIALLSPVARMQAYYATTVLPLAALVLGVMPAPGRSRYITARLAALVLVIALSTAPALARARGLYLPDADAFMPRFADVIAHRPEQRVVTVAHYDKTLLAYYLARAQGRAIDWDNLEPAVSVGCLAIAGSETSLTERASKCIEPLVAVHSLDAGSEQAATSRLDQIIAAGPTLVIERDAVLLPGIAERLSACERLLEAPTARLVRCAPPGSP